MGSISISSLSFCKSIRLETEYNAKRKDQKYPLIIEAILFGRLLLLFILVPLADLILLLMIAGWTHWTTTVLLVILSGIVGAWLAKSQSNALGLRIRKQMVQNMVPSDLLTDGALIIFAAALLITPGLITDFIGLTLLIPFTRSWYKSLAMKLIKRHFSIQVNTRSYGKAEKQPEEGVVDGEVLYSSDEKNF